MDPNPTICSHQGCTCRVEVQGAVKREGKVFCSERCADDRGCDHEQCNCGDFPEERPAP
jgi:hypothetical protein